MLLFSFFKKIVFVIVKRSKKLRLVEIRKI